MISLHRVVDTTAHTFVHSFEECPINVVDSLVLCQLAYLRFEHCGLQKQERLFQLGSLAGETHNPALLHNVPVSKSALIELMRSVAASPRYRWLCATEHVNCIDAEIGKQFSATTYLFEDGTAYVAFRGTDKSVIGWKENFTMLHPEPTPSQQASAAYLQAVAQRFSGPLYVGGHSKGGNLAVYAATNAEPKVQGRIVSVYNHDGPGFHYEFFEQDGYQRMKSRIHKTVPEIAAVGMLFRDQENYTIVESTGFDVFQHDMLSWVVKNGQLSVKDSVDKAAQQATKKLNAWMEVLSNEQRKTIVDAVLLILTSTKSESITDLLPNAIWNAPTVVKVVSDFSNDTKQLLHDMFSSLDALFQQSEK